MSLVLATALLLSLGPAEPTLTWYTGEMFEASEYTPLVFAPDGSLFVVRFGTMNAYYQLMVDGTANSVNRDKVEAVAPLSKSGLELKACDAAFKKAHPGALSVSPGGKLVFGEFPKDHKACIMEPEGKPIDLTKLAFQLDLSSHMKKMADGDVYLTSVSAGDDEGKLLAGTAEIDGKTQLWILRAPGGIFGS